MGVASSTASSSSSPEQQEQESLAASTGSLPALRAAFAKLAQPNNSSSISPASLQEIFTLSVTNFTFTAGPASSPHFSELLSNLGSAIVSLLFPADGGGGVVGITWVDFLRGYNRCCARVPVSQSINLLYRLYSFMARAAGVPCDLEFDAETDDCKVGGSFGVGNLFMFLSICWILLRCSKVHKGQDVVKEGLVIPDVSHLMLSAMVSCDVVVDDESVWNCSIFNIDERLSVQKLQAWVLRTAPGLANCLSKYVHDRLEACAATEDSFGTSSVSSLAENTPAGTSDAYLLTQGRAWAVSLTLRDRISEELLLASFQGMNTENLLYRSSVHGKGMSRFWSNIEGYNGPLMILLSSHSNVGAAVDKGAREWVIGILMMHGLENRETFFGASGYVYAISPIFRVLKPSGKEKNFVYCHLHPAVKVYEPNPKPVGLGFGGSIGNERIFLDEDFAYVTIRHHAVDKTYEHLPLIPNQGYLPVQAAISEVEVWGFGGKEAKEQQDAYKKRETIFSEQRRKVDLKNFASWEDSPEKMMMDMMSDPNRVRREDR